MILVHYEQGCNKASTCGPGLFTNTDSNSISASYAVPSKEIKVTYYYCKVAPAHVCVLFFVLACIEGRDFERAAVSSLFEWRSIWGRPRVSPKQVNIPGVRKHLAGPPPGSLGWFALSLNLRCWQVHPQGEGGLKTHVVTGGNAREEVTLTHCYSMPAPMAVVNGLPVQLNSVLKTPV